MARGDKHYFCSLVHVKSLCIFTSLVEFLALSHAVITLSSAYNTGYEYYSGKDVSNVFNYNLLLPIMIFQCAWLVAIIIHLLGIKTFRPSLGMPLLSCRVLHVLMSAVALVACLVTSDWSKWQSIYFACILGSIVFEVVCIHIGLECFKYLKYKRLMHHDRIFVIEPGMDDEAFFEALRQYADEFDSISHDEV